MKKQNWWGGCFAALVVLNCMPLTVAGADLTLERARQQLLGEWQVGFHPESYAKGVKTPLRPRFLSGEVGPVWRFDKDGSATAFVPCDINAVFPKGVVARGTWNLLDEGRTLKVNAQMTIATREALDLRGPLVFEPLASDDTTANSMSFDNRHFGRYDDRIFVCD